MTVKHFHEIRDPVHTFIKLDSDEREVVNSRPVQRLRDIHQLAMTYLLYPGATHRRFEHSLGVMELAGRVFDVITHPDHLREDVRDALPEVTHPDKLTYWRRVLRMAALCHDIGHFPFSHATEDLLPGGLTHEDVSVKLIRSEEMCQYWGKTCPPLVPEHIVKLAVGKEKLEGEAFTAWESLLSEIIVGDTFGVDRIDYLLRDAHHTGVDYGKFDYHGLVDTLRALPDKKGSGRVWLGVELGGIHSAAALLLARHFMTTQVYRHRIRLIFDIHLQDFLKLWLDEAKYTVSIDAILNKWNDVEVMLGIMDASRNSSGKVREAAQRIVRRKPFRPVYQCQRDRIDFRVGQDIEADLVGKFGKDSVRRKFDDKGSIKIRFPVLSSGKIVPSSSISGTVREIPRYRFDMIFVEPECEEEAKEIIQRSKCSAEKPTIHVTSQSPRLVGF